MRTGAANVKVERSYLLRDSSGQALEFVHLPAVEVGTLPENTHVVVEFTCPAKPDLLCSMGTVLAKTDTPAIIKGNNGASIFP